MNIDAAMDQDVPAIEKEAAALVGVLGVDTAQAELDALSAKAEAAMRSLCGDDLTSLPIGFTALNYMSEKDNERRHLLSLGISLNDSDTPAEAHKRIVARSRQRKLQAKRRAA